MKEPEKIKVQLKAFGRNLRRARMSRKITLEALESALT